VDLGITLPTSGPHASPAAIVRMACEAERLGYAAVWTHERLLYALGDIAQPGGPPRPLPDHYRTTYEPIETLAYVAARTTTIRLGISVLAALFHVPVVLARRLATLDQFSGGRVTAGLGQGWIKQEFVAANVPVKRRGRGFEEFIAAMRAAWSPDPVAFEGRFYRIPPSQIAPKPVQTGGIPIIVGAFAPAAVDRAARVADGLNPIAFSLHSLEETVRRFRRAARAAGRDVVSLKVVVRANTPITARAITDRRPFLGGSPEQIASDLRALEQLSIDHVMFTNLVQPPIDEQVQLLDRLIKAVADESSIHDRGRHSLLAEPPAPSEQAPRSPSGVTGPS
jgi:probable F420-dependent oxidoreductase